MKIISLKRAGGKTRDACALANIENAHLVVSSPGEARKLSQVFSGTNNFPATYAELIKYGKRNGIERVVIDNIEDFLRYVIGEEVEIIAFTHTLEE